MLSLITENSKLHPHQLHVAWKFVVLPAVMYGWKQLVFYFIGESINAI
jgi:hypothetical protein